MYKIYHYHIFYIPMKIPFLSIAFLIMGIRQITVKFMGNLYIYVLSFGLVCMFWFCNSGVIEKAWKPFFCSIIYGIYIDGEREGSIATCWWIEPIILMRSFIVCWHDTMCGWIYVNRYLRWFRVSSFLFFFCCEI